MKKTLFLSAILGAALCSNAFGGWNEDNTIYTFTGSGDETWATVVGTSGLTKIVVEQGVAVNGATLTMNGTLNTVEVNGTLTLSGNLRFASANTTLSGSGTVTAGSVTYYSQSDSQFTQSVANLNVNGTTKVDAFYADPIYSGNNVSLKQGLEIANWNGASTVKINGATLTLGNTIRRSGGNLNPNVAFSGDSVIDVSGLSASVGSLGDAPAEHANGFATQDVTIQVFSNIAGYTYADEATVTYKHGDIVLGGKEILDTDNGSITAVNKGGVYFLQDGTTSMTTAELQTAAHAEGLVLAGANVAAGNTIEVTTNDLTLANISGAGNVIVSTASSLTNSASSAATGSLTVKGVQLTVGDGDSRTASLSSFSSVALDGGTIYYNNNHDTLHDVSVATGKTGIINSYDMGQNGAKLVLEGTTSVGGTLTIQNQYNALFEIKQLTGAGALNIKGTNGGTSSADNEVVTYTFDDISGYTGTMTFNNSKATVNLNIAHGGNFTGSFTKTNASAVTLNITATDSAVNLGDRSVSGIDAMIIDGAQVTSSRADNGTGLTTAALTIKNGGNLTVSGNDAFGYVNGTYTPSVTVVGTQSAVSKITVDGGHNIGLSGDLILQGNTDIAQKNGTANTCVEFYGGNIVVSGTNNTISTNLALRGNHQDLTNHPDRNLGVIDVAEGGSLNITGNIITRTNWGGDGYTAAQVLTKRGEGMLTISGEVKGGTINGDGANTLINGNISGGTLNNVAIGKAGGYISVTGASTINDLKNGRTNGGNYSLIVTNNARLTLTGTSDLTKLNDTETSVGGSFLGVDSGAELIVGNGTAAADITTGAVMFSNKGTSNNGKVTVKSDATLNVTSTNYTANSKMDGLYANELVNDGTINVAGKTLVNTLTNTGTMNLRKEDTVVNSITLGGGTITLGTEGDHNAALTTTTLTVNADSLINANLVVNGGTLTFAKDAVLTMGCTVSIDGADVYVTIDGTIDDMLAAVRNGNYLLLIDGLEEGDADAQALTLNTVYINGATDPELHLAFVKNTYSENGAYAIVVAPEPATATLSLLALAALASRRRRH